MISVTPLPAAGPWPTPDPFLFCMHHRDEYPRGKPDFSPDASLAGRQLGADFSGKDGFSMYHGLSVPGFPRHPHRGFETVTVARAGLIDHSDSLGATARFGEGDGQWMTAGRGIVHSEMFPLINHKDKNPAELFQLWLNLPAKSKMVPPHFTMMWNIPVWQQDGVTIQVTAGHLPEVRTLAPPPSSWAADPANDVTIMAITMKAGTRYQTPASPIAAPRVLYFFAGTGLRIDGQDVPPRTAITLSQGEAATLEALSDVSLLLLGGRPIGEPVAAHGPFVMNTRDELMQAFTDYNRTQFGGWPWPSDAPHHAYAERFAIHADGRREEAP